MPSSGLWPQECSVSLTQKHSGLDLLNFQQTPPCSGVIFHFSGRSVWTPPSSCQLHIFHELLRQSFFSPMAMWKDGAPPKKITTSWTSGSEPSSQRLFCGTIGFKHLSFPSRSWLTKGSPMSCNPPSLDIFGGKQTVASWRGRVLIPKSVAILFPRRMRFHHILFSHVLSHGPLYSIPLCVETMMGFREPFQGYCCVSVFVYLKSLASFQRFGTHCPGPAGRICHLLEQRGLRELWPWPSAVPVRGPLSTFSRGRAEAIKQTSKMLPAVWGESDNIWISCRPLDLENQRGQGVDLQRGRQTACRYPAAELGHCGGGKVGLIKEKISRRPWAAHKALVALSLSGDGRKLLFSFQQEDWCLPF